MLREKNTNFAEEHQDFWFTRIFSDSDHLLSVYYDRDREIIRFHFLTGLRSDNKKNLTWSESTGILYSLVDAGESSPMVNHSPFTAGSAKLNVDTFWDKFSKISAEISNDVRDFIKAKLDSHQKSDN